MARSSSTSPLRRAGRAGAVTNATTPPSDSAAFSDSAPVLEEEVALLVSRTRRLLWNAANRSLESHQESIHLYRILSHLVRNGVSMQKDLADATTQHPAATSRLLDLLERRRLVVRQRDPRDRRNVRVAVTPLGRTRFRVLGPTVRAGVTAALQPLTTADRTRLVTLLRKLSPSCEGRPRGD